MLKMNTSIKHVDTQGTVCFHMCVYSLKNETKVDVIRSIAYNYGF